MSMLTIYDRALKRILYNVVDIADAKSVAAAALAINDTQPEPTGDSKATEWPADAPEWANEFVITKEFRGRYSTKKIVGRETVSRPQPPKRKIDWSKLDEFAERYCEFDEDGDIRFPSLWIPWNINSLGGDCPVPDGVRIAYHCANTGCRFNDASCAPWGEITAFRITGIADGWE